MHYKRIIPCMDVDAGRVVKGTRFIDIRDAGDPVELAAHYDAHRAPTSSCSSTSRRPRTSARTVVELARRAADEVFVPFTIGGGVREVADAQAVLDAGADKVSVNSAAVARPELVAEMADVFGAQCVVLAIDAKRRDDGFEVYVAGGRTATGRDAVAWAREGVERGAGEILLTSMDRDGTKDGYDLELVRADRGGGRGAGDRLRGRGEPRALVDGLQAGADAVLCASIFHYGEYTIPQVREALRAAGVPMRPVSVCNVRHYERARRNDRARAHDHAGSRTARGGAFMTEHNVGAVVIIDPEEPGPGIVTERDVVRSLGAGQDPDNELVRDHLTANATFADGDWDLEQAR